MVGQACFLCAVLTLICLHLTSGGPTDSLSLRSSAEKNPRTLDEVLMQAAGGQNMLRSAGMDSDTIIDGLDMVLSREQYARLYKGIQQRSQSDDDKLVKLWPNGEIPYEIDSGSFSPARLRKIQEGITTWQDLTCVIFRPPTSSDVNKVQIRSATGCWSLLGMKKDKQPQTLSLNSRKCFYQGTVEHELGHVIGLVHEHQRPERDYHLGVYESNVIPFYRNQLQVYRQGSVDKMGLDYDYYSVMHYGKAAFSYDGVTPTMYAYDRRGQQHLPQVTEDLGKVLGPSFLDVKLVNLLYNCSATCQTKPSCRADCFVDKNCRCFCKEDLPPVPCKNYLTECEMWMQRGECTKNRPYMEYFCRKSCKMCPTHGTIPPEKPTTGPPCKDTRGDCKVLADRGDCQSNRSAMLKDCRKTCTRCTGTSGSSSCVDDDANCPAWKKAGYCDYYPHMRPTCKKSCGVCT